MTNIDAWIFDVDKVRRRDPEEISRVHRAMTHPNVLIFAFASIQRTMTGVPGVVNPTVEDKFVYYIQSLGDATASISVDGDTNNVDGGANIRRSRANGLSTPRMGSNSTINADFAIARSDTPGVSAPRAGSRGNSAARPSHRSLNERRSGHLNTVGGTLNERRSGGTNPMGGTSHGQVGMLASGCSTEGSNTRANNSATQPVIQLSSRVISNIGNTSRRHDKGKGAQTREDVLALENARRLVESARLVEEQALQEKEKADKEIPAQRLREDKRREVEYWKKEAKKLAKKLKHDKDAKKRRKKRKQASSSSESVSDSDSSDSDSLGKEKKKTKSRKQRKHKKGPIPSSSEDSSSSGPEVAPVVNGVSGGAKKKKMLLKLDEDRIPMEEHDELVQFRIRQIAQKFWPGWVHWSEEKKMKKIRRFHRVFRSAWANGRELETSWIHKIVMLFLKNRRSREKKIVKECYSVVNGQYHYPNNCKVPRFTFNEIMRELEATNVHNPKLHKRAHQGDNGSQACAGRRITNVWERGGWRGILGRYRNKYKKDPSAEDIAFGREWTWKELIRKTAYDAKGVPWVPLSKFKSLTQKIVAWKFARHIMDIPEVLEPRPTTPPETAAQRELRHKEVHDYVGTSTEGDRLLQHFPNADCVTASLILENNDISDHFKAADEELIGTSSESEGLEGLYEACDLVLEMTTSSSANDTSDSDTRLSDNEQLDEVPLPAQDEEQNMENESTMRDLAEDLPGAFGGDATQQQSDDMGSEGDDERDEDVFHSSVRDQARRFPPKTRGAKPLVPYKLGTKKKKNKHL